MSHVLFQIYLKEDTDEPDSKKVKGSPYFVSELAYLLARCEEKMPFVFLGEEVIYTITPFPFMILSTKLS